MEPRFKSTTVDWTHERKKRSRTATTLAIYNTCFGPSIPPGTQYWTMCGKHYRGSEGREYATNRSEFSQLSAAGLFQPDQFHGVDHEGEIISINRRLYPHVQWHHGDFYWTMHDALCVGEFNPAVINFDSTREPLHGVADLRRIMRLIDNNVGTPLLLLANFVLLSPYGGVRSHEPSEVEDELVGRPKEYRVPDHWTFIRGHYGYLGGTGDKARSHMSTYALVKRTHRGTPTYTYGRDYYVEA